MLPFSKIYATFSLIFLLIANFAYANPSGGVIVSGKLKFTTNGKTETITQASQRAIVDWNNFIIQNGELTQFIQPNVSSTILNRVTGRYAADVNGSLTANGIVFLVDPNGVYLGKNANVNMGSLVASTLDIRNQDFNNGIYNFNPSLKGVAPVLNNGVINAVNTVNLIGYGVDFHNSIALVGSTNSGTIDAPYVKLIDANSVSLSGDLTQLTYILRGSNGLTANWGTINAGTTVLAGNYVNVNGNIYSNNLQIAPYTLNVINGSGPNQVNKVTWDWLKKQASKSNTILSNPLSIWLNPLSDLNLANVAGGTIMIPTKLTLSSQEGNITFANQNNTIIAKSFLVDAGIHGTGNAFLANLNAFLSNIDVNVGGNLSFNNLTTSNGHVYLTAGQNITQLSGGGIIQRGTPPCFVLPICNPVPEVILQGAQIGNVTIPVLVNSTGNVEVDLKTVPGATAEAAYINNTGTANASYSLSTNILGSNSSIYLANGGNIGDLSTSLYSNNDSVVIENFGSIATVEAYLQGNESNFSLSNHGFGSVINQISINSSGDNTTANVLSLGLFPGIPNLPLKTLQYVTTGAHDALYYNDLFDMTANGAGSVINLNLNVKDDSTVVVKDGGQYSSQFFNWVNGVETTAWPTSDLIFSHHP